MSDSSPSGARTWIKVAGAVAVCFAAAAGLWWARRAKPEDVLVQKAFSAMGTGKWEQFLPLVITPVAFDRPTLKKPEIAAATAARDAHLRKLREDFERASTGGEGYVDWRNGRCLGATEALKAGVEKAPRGAAVAYRVHALRVWLNERVVDTRVFSPQFVITSWGGEPRILRLVLPGG